MIRFDDLQSSVKELKENIHQHKVKNLSSSKRDTTLDDYESKLSKVVALSERNMKDLLDDLKDSKTVSEITLKDILNDFKKYEQTLTSRVPFSLIQMKECWIN